MRRSELSRKPKPKKCRWCKEVFTPTKPAQVCCEPFPCAIEYGKHKEAKKREKARREQKRADRKRLEEMKTKPQLTKEAQREFNRYIRLRDHDKPCISCGRSPDDSQLITGSKFDAGHYRSVGACPALRFEPLNCARQCVYCNRNLSGNAVDYRLGLIDRIGIDRVEWLEGSHEANNYTRDDLRQIRDKYRKLANDLEKQIGGK